jgi:hypothetical protein
VQPVSLALFHTLSLCPFTYTRLLACACDHLQVLLLDADNVPLQDPSYLFKAPQVKQHGVMFWLDYWSNNFASHIYVGQDKVYPLMGLDKHMYWVRRTSTASTCTSYC